MAEKARGAHGAVLLVGMMGVGKSSVGRALAARLGWRFIDADREIERVAGRPIARIFEEEGEARFRALETEVLRGLPRQGVVVSLGGGALVREGNAAILEAKGEVVWLDASIETLVARTTSGPDRPLLAGLDADARAARLRALEAERRAAYARAPWRVWTDARSRDEVVDEIVEKLALRGAAG